MPTLDSTQYSIIYNMLSLGLASMLFTSLFLFISRERVLPRYRMAVVVSATVTAIAAYHYFRIFDSFKNAFVISFDPAKMDHVATLGDEPYNVGYRYVDWLLTVPLLLLETVAVLALARAIQRSLLTKLIPAATAMILLGYPGDAGLDLFGLSAPVWGFLSTIPFLYILYVLFVELTKSLERQSPAVAATIGRLRLLLIATWGVYPISFILNMNADGFEASSFVMREVGYTIADVLAKCLYGLVIFKIARMKSAEDSKEFAESEYKD